MMSGQLMTSDAQDLRQKSHQDHLSSGAKFPLTLAAIGLHSPENLGSLIRLSDALGVETILLLGDCVLPNNPRVAKTARSTEKAVSLLRESNADVAIENYRKQGYKIVCLELTKQSIKLAELVVKDYEKILLVLGSERQGVPEDVLVKADVCVEIPMQGINSSMNIVSAAAIAIYQITQQMRIG